MKLWGLAKHRIVSNSTDLSIIVYREFSLQTLDGVLHLSGSVLENFQIIPKAHSDLSFMFIPRGVERPLNHCLNLGWWSNPCEQDIASIRKDTLLALEVPNDGV